MNWIDTCWPISKNPPVYGLWTLLYFVEQQYWWKKKGPKNKPNNKTDCSLAL